MSDVNGIAELARAARLEAISVALSLTKSKDRSLEKKRKMELPFCTLTGEAFLIGAEVFGRDAGELISVLYGKHIFSAKS